MAFWGFQNEARVCRAPVTFTRTPVIKPSGMGRVIPLQRTKVQKVRSKQVCFSGPIKGGTAALDEAVQYFLEIRSSPTEVPKEEIDAAGECLEALAKEMGKNKLDWDTWDGNFDTLAYTDKRRAMEGGVTTLGLASFNAWQPADLPVRVTDGMLFKGEEDGIPNTFHLTNGIVDVASGLAGYSSAIGIYYPDAEIENRAVIEFNRVKLEPADSSPEYLEKWKEVFLAANPAMGEDGVAEVKLPKSAMGSHTVVYMSEDLQIVRGNYGSFSVLKRKTH